MSAGCASQKLPLWADSSFLKLIRNEFESICSTRAVPEVQCDENLEIGRH